MSNGGRQGRNFEPTLPDFRGLEHDSPGRFHRS